MLLWRSLQNKTKKMASSDFTFYLDEADYNRLVSTFIGLSEIEKNNAIKEALGQGMGRMVTVGKIALKQSILHPKKSKGNLVRSLTSRVQIKKGNTKGIAGFKRSTRYSRIGGGNHSYLVDRGTAERWQRSTGRYTGSVRRGRPNTGSHFWTDTVAQEGPRALDTLMEGINKAILKIMGEHYYG